ncbi:MAG TPA: hypothetical protein VHB79_39170 [Polyangiaceae bacterium]|nr:hypothetical protein [Polyangiaceae bacterium]
MSEADEKEELGADLLSALKGGGEEPAPPDVLAGFQKKVRERSGGKFYEEGWSTSRHPPINTYLITSLLMLAVLGIIYALLAPLSGEPVPVENTPQPVQIIPTPH